MKTNDHILLTSAILALAFSPAATSQETKKGRPAFSSRVPAGRWIGQDGHDYVGPSSALAGSDVQDIHIQLAGLPPKRAIAKATVRGLGGAEWQYNGPFGPWRAHILRDPGSPNADVFIEPTQTETGRPFTIQLTFEDGGTIQFDVKGGRADSNRRMPSASLAATWVKQSKDDRVGPETAVGPDGVVDALIELNKLSPQVEITSVTIRAAGGDVWDSGVNPRGNLNAELARSRDNPARAQLYFQPRRDIAGQELRISVHYANNKSDEATLKAGPFDPKRRVERPRPAVTLANTATTAEWLGQRDRTAASPGAVRIAVRNLPSPIVAAALNDEAGFVWVRKTRDNVPFEAGSDVRGMEFAGARKSEAELWFEPERDELRSAMTLRLLLGDGKTTVVQFRGGPADLALRVPLPDASATTARPGDDLNALAARFGTVTLATGTHRLNAPLELERPITLKAERGAVLEFSQRPNDPTWTSAIKVHAGNTTLEGFAVRFATPIRWTPNIDYGPAVIGSTDNHDQGHTALKVNIVLRELDLQSPPPTGKWEEAARLIRMARARSGRIEKCVLKGGSIEFLNGPWIVADNDYRGTVPGTFAYSVISAHNTHDLVVRGNKAQPAGPSGKTWRFLVQTRRGFNDVIEGNTVVGIGPRDDDTVAGDNAPEIFLTESYGLHFEGKPLGISPNGQLLTIPKCQGDRPASGSVVAILEGPHAGDWRRIAQPISESTYLMQSSLPAGDYAISIATGFVRETYRGNVIDSRGGSVAANLVFVGNHFGAKVLENHLLGAGEAFKITAAPTEHPVAWGWSRAPFLGAAIEGNIIEDSVRGGTLSVEHGPAIKSTKSRTYMSVSFKNNSFRWSPKFREFAASARERPPGMTIGDEGSLDPSELLLEESGNTAIAGSSLGLRVRSARVNGVAVRGKLLALPGSAAGESARGANRPPAVR